MNIEKLISDSRKLMVSLEQPDGASETYLYFVDTPGFCLKLDGDEETLVDFDFIPEWVSESVHHLRGFK